MRVVSNTSPLTNLAAINRLGTLRQPYGKLVIAKRVWAELNASGRIWPGRGEVAAAGWVGRRTVGNTPLVEALRRDLDPREAATTALALELNTDPVMIGERDDAL